MRRLSFAAPLAAVGASLLLAVSPILAAGPVSPATGKWSAIGSNPFTTFDVSGLGLVLGAKVGPDGRLYAYGQFDNAAGDPTADNLAVYDPVSGAWSGIGSNGAGDGAISSTVDDIAWYGGVLYAGGNYVNAGGIAGLNYLAAWNGTTWTSRGDPAPFNSAVLSLSVAGGKLYIGGAFTNAGGDPTADYLASFDGYHYHGLAPLFASNGSLNGMVRTVTALADGRVFVGGDFVNADAAGKADRVAWWDANTKTWSALGGSAAPDNAVNGSVYHLALAGTKIYISGAFTDVAGNLKADRIAMWTGTAWTNLGSNVAGTDGPISGAVGGIAVYGSNLIVAGNFGTAGSATGVGGLAVWNGTKWMGLTTVLPDTTPRYVSTAGRVLFVSGQFTQVGSGASAVANTAGLAAFGLPGVPSAPRSLSATAGSKKVTLKWYAPTTTNGSGPVRDYIVQYRKYGTTTWKNFVDGVKSTTGATVTGLTTGTTYQFRVVARTDWGVGSWSATVTKKAN